MNKKEQKKKDREKRVRKKLLSRREHSIQEAKEKRKMEALAELNEKKLVPITNYELAKQREARRKEKIMAQLERNQQILKAIEEEVLREEEEERLRNQQELPEAKVMEGGSFLTPETALRNILEKH